MGNVVVVFRKLAFPTVGYSGRELVSTQRGGFHPHDDGSHRRDPMLALKLVKWILHFVVTASLLLAFVQAPVLHSHAGHEPHAHYGHVLEAAHPHDDASGPEWEASEHDSQAEFLDWIGGDGKETSSAQAEPVALLVVPAPSSRPGRVAELRPQSHDPPGLLRLPPRAPPV